MIPLYSQTESSKIKEYGVYELNINDSLFLSDLDSIIFKMPCPNLQDEDNKYFRIHFSSPDIINVTLYKSPNGEYSFGYFKYINYLFFVSGDLPENLFKRKKNKQKFSYKTVPGIATIEEFPFWRIIYKRKRLRLIEQGCW